MHMPLCASARIAIESQTCTVECIDSRVLRLGPAATERHDEHAGLPVGLSQLWRA